MNGLADLLDVDNILLNLNAGNRREVLKRFVEHLSDTGYLDNPNEIYQQLLQREKLETTAIEKNIAIPHVRSQKLDRVILAAGIDREGVDFHSMDGFPTKLFFLILAPISASSQHLKILAAVSRLVHKEETVKRLVHVDTPEEFIEVIKETTRE